MRVVAQNRLPRKPSRRRLHGPRFVGRAKELAHLAELDHLGERLITVHGAAGMGKTRLVREYAQREEETRHVVFIDLSHATDIAEIENAVAAAFDADEWVGPALVILDNFEHIVREAASVIEPLLAHDDVTVLVTSREYLHISGEVVLALEPLSLPSRRGVPSEALELLLDCIQRKGVSSGIDVPACEQIVRELDGIPLAIELAAPRVALFGAAAVLERLSNRLSVLTHPRRDAARNQSTLRNAITISWNLLGEPGRHALAQCSIFRGSFSLDAVEAILDVDDSTAVMGALQSLREKSLLNNVPSATGQPRFRLFLSIAEYAREKLLEHPELAEGVRRRHADYYIHHAETMATAMHAAASAKALEQLAAERDNIVAAVESSTDPQRTTDELTLAVRGILVLRALESARGGTAALGALIERVLAAAAGRNVDSALMAEVRMAHGDALHRLGRPSEAMAAHRAAIAMANELGAIGLEGRATMELAICMSRRTTPDEPLRLFRKAIALHHEAGNTHQEGTTLRHLARLLREHGRLGEARTAALRAFDLLHECGDVAYAALARTELALVGLEESDLPFARAHAIQALAAMDASGRPLHTAFVRGVVGIVGLAEGDAAACLVALETVLENSFLEHGCPPGYARYEAYARIYMGMAHLELGAPSRASVALQRACAILAPSAGERRAFAVAQAFLAAARAELGDHDGAERDLEGATAVVIGGDSMRNVQNVIDVLTELVTVSRAATAGPLTSSHPIARRASERLARASMMAADRSAPGFDLRLALRHARRVLEPLGLAAQGQNDAPGRVLTLHVEGDWAEFPSGERADLRRKDALRRILLELARHRIAKPGIAVDPKRLVEAGWPTEHIDQASARNRLAVVLSMLRKIGLRSVLVSEARGYLLDPSVAIAWSAPEPVERKA